MLGKFILIWALISLVVVLTFVGLITVIEAILDWIRSKR